MSKLKLIMLWSSPYMVCTEDCVKTMLEKLAKEQELNDDDLKNDVEVMDVVVNEEIV